MNQRRRYIAFEVIGDRSKGDVLRAVSSLRAGQPESDRALVKLVLYDASSQKGLLRCGHRQLDEIKASMVGAGGGAKKASFRTVGVSGTIRAAKRKFLMPLLEKG